MKEVKEILNKIAQLAPDENAILATVVDVKGSSYRLAGARMLIDENGSSIGTVSGGCLEADVLERAKKVLETGQAAVITYDTTKDEDSVFGFGMGCRGVVRILLEKVENNTFINFLRECFEQRKHGAIATLISKNDDFFLPIGAKIFVKEENKVNHSHETESEKHSFLQNVVSDAQQAIEDKQSKSKIYETENGEVEFFIETISPPVSLLLFGAGFDALPLTEFAENLGWQITVIDHRPAWANQERFLFADKIIVSRAENLEKNFFEDENSVAVIMTHNYERDLQTLPILLNSNFRYIGALGPRKRTEKILAESGQSFSENQLNRLYAPIGLDLGAETPEEIALSIIAEIQSVLADRNPGFLREKKGGIHQQKDEN